MSGRAFFNKVKAGIGILLTKRSIENNISMTKEVFPEGEAVFRHKPHSAELFTITVDEIDKAGESFIGIIRIDEPDAAYFLFFLRGDAYAAGYITNGKPMPLSIRTSYSTCQLLQTRELFLCLK